jgi:hypothetical protein
MEEQKTITISVDEYSVFLSEMTRFDILKEELIAIYGEYVNVDVKDRLLRIAGIETEDVTGKETEAAEVIHHD